MKDDEIKNVLLDLLQKIAPDIESEELEMDDNFREEFGIDSFDFLQFVVGLDEAFGIQTPEEDYGKIQTLNALTAYIKSAKNSE